jgi:hypothetical protein
MDDEPPAKRAKTIIGSPQDAPIFDLLPELFTNHVLPHLGHLDRALLSLTCKYYYERKSPVVLGNYILIAACALSGMWHLFDWAVRYSTKVDAKMTLGAAIQSANLEMVRTVIPYYIHAKQHGYEKKPNKHGRRAFYSSLFPELFANLDTFSIANPMAVAASCDNVEAAQLLMGYDILSRWNDKVLLTAVDAGAVRFLTWAVENGLTIGYNLPRVSILAAKKGHRAIFELIVSMPTAIEAIPSMASRIAALHGHKSTLEYLISLPCISDDVLLGAVEGGHVDIVDMLLKLVRENASMASRIETHIEQLYIAAAKGGHVHMLNKLALDNADMPISSVVPCYYAAYVGKWDALHWLHEHGFHWDVSVGGALTNGYYLTYPDDPDSNTEQRLRELKWAVERGCPIDIATVGNAARCDQELAAWLLPRVPVPFNAAKFYLAIQWAHIAPWRWGLEHGITPPRITEMDRFIHDEEDLDKVELVNAYWRKHDEEREHGRIEIGSGGKIVITKRQTGTHEDM